MRLNERKDLRQQEFAKKWFYSSHNGATVNGSGTFWAVGGFGKTYGTVKYIISSYVAKAKENKHVVVLVPRANLVAQWNDCIKMLIPEEYAKFIRVRTVQYMIANSHVFDNGAIQIGLLVVDELHMFYADEYWEYINNTKLKFNHNLGLTATYKDPQGRHHKALDLYPIIDRITAQEALEAGYISRYIEYNLGLTLEDDEVDKYVEYSDLIAEYKSKFDDDFGLMIKCTAGERTKDSYIPPIQFAYRIAEKNGWHTRCSPEINAAWNPNSIIDYAKKGMAATYARKMLLYNSMTKVQAGVEIVKRYNPLKIISFSQSTIYADTFAAYCRKAGYESVVYHTKLANTPMLDEDGQFIKYQSGAKKGQVKLFGQKVLKNYAIEQIKSGAVKIISTASALDAGFDVEDMNIGIISSRSSNFNSQNQRGFRVTRVDPFEPNSIALIINLYFKRTVDESWLKTAQQETENTVYWINGIDEISYTPDISYEL